MKYRLSTQEEIDTIIELIVKEQVEYDNLNVQETEDYKNSVKEQNYFSTLETDKNYNIVTVLSYRVDEDETDVLTETYLIFHSGEVFNITGWDFINNDITPATAKNN